MTPNNDVHLMVPRLTHLPYISGLIVSPMNFLVNRYSKHLHFNQAAYCSSFMSILVGCNKVEGNMRGGS